MRLADLGNYEPLLSDERVEVLVHKLQSAYGYGKLKDTQFVTFIQPAMRATADVNGVKVPTWVSEMAVFGCLSPNPRRYVGIGPQQILTHATVALADFREADAEASHYVAAPDPAMGIFRTVVVEHLRQLDDLKSLIN